MEVEDKGDAFDPDAIVLKSFLQEQRAILHDNVVKTSHVIHSKSSLKHLLAFDLSVRIYLDVHPDPLEVKKKIVVKLFHDLFYRLNDEHGNDAAVLKTKWILLNQMQNHGLQVDKHEEAVTNVLLTLAEESPDQNKP